MSSVYFDSGRAKIEVITSGNMGDTGALHVLWDAKEIGFMLPIESLKFGRKNEANLCNEVY